MCREMRVPWLVKMSSLYFHKARALRRTSALLRYDARSLVFNAVVAELSIHKLKN